MLFLFSDILPEALQTNCGRCSEKQKTAAYRSIKRLKKEYPKIWDQLSALWDPDGFYINRFEATFENDQIRDNEIQTTDKPIVLSNRFGDDTAEATNTISTNIPPVSPFSTTTTTSTSTSTSTTTSTSTSTRTSTATSTNRPSTVVTNTVIRPIQTRPQSPGIGANIQATVSFGSNVVHGFVKGLSDLGARVVQTGTKIADAVITAVVRP
nr:chemosensory protein 2 [Lytta caraganae]